MVYDSGNSSFCENRVDYIAIDEDGNNWIGLYDDGISTIDDTHWGDDVNGHGTHVAGSVAALDNEWGVVGVAHLMSFSMPSKYWTMCGSPSESR